MSETGEATVGKTGWKTTEFWSVVALLALTLANKYLDLGLTSTELWSMAIAVAGYGGARGLAKLRA